jgi:predicted PurR-regulated permease PerM
MQCGDESGDSLGWRLAVLNVASRGMKTTMRESANVSGPGAERVVRHTIIVVGIALALLILVALFGYAASALLLVFGGILLATFMRMLGDRLSAMLPRRLKRWALSIAVGLLLAVIGLTFLWAGPRVSDQLGQLVDQLPSSIHYVRQQLEQRPWGAWLVTKSQDVLSDGSKAINIGALFFASLMQGMGALVIVLFLGLYFSAAPGWYLDGLVRLLPFHSRRLARDALVTAGRELEQWLLGRLLAMAFVGAATGAALWLVGIPLALLLGLLAGLFGFIPYVGPVVSALPAVLIALQQEGPYTAAMIIGLYFGIQIIQDYVLTPLIQQRTVSLPPVLTIASQLFAGIWVGPIGVTLAMPLTVVLKSLVRTLYLEAYLGDYRREAGHQGSGGGARRG